MISESLLDGETLSKLAEVIATQPVWSDLPVLVSSHRRRGRSVAELSVLGNVALLDAPLRLRSFLQASRSALRARRRQYELRQAILRRDEFLAMLAHELRNPMSAIALAGEHLRGEVGSDSRALAILRRQTRQLTRIVDDLLDVARVASGKMTILRSRFDLGRGVGLWAESFEERFRDAGIGFEIRALPVAWVDGDEARLEQVVGNLLSNALKYTPRGGSVRVEMVSRDGWTQLTVADDGTGIAPEMLKSIFDQFVQVDRTLDRADGGMGVGLTLVRRLVELHGGSIQVHSEGLERGSRFEMIIPLAPDPVAAAEAAAVAVPDAPAGRTVVVVEDEADIRAMMVMILEEAGHRVVEAEDGAAGLEAVRRERPAAVLLDIGLPRLDGHEVARLIREELGPSIRLLAITGHGKDNRSRASNFDRYLTKPVGRERLLQELQSVLS